MFKMYSTYRVCTSEAQKLRSQLCYIVLYTFHQFTHMSNAKRPSKGGAEVTEIPRLANVCILSLLIDMDYHTNAEKNLATAGMYPERTKMKNSSPNFNPMR
jgi:hypothetical protein